VRHREPAPWPSSSRRSHSLRSPHTRCAALTLAALVHVWGAYALVDGVLLVVCALVCCLLLVVAALRTASADRWCLFEGPVGLSPGLVTVAEPELRQLALEYIVAAWVLSWPPGCYRGRLGVIAAAWALLMASSSSLHCSARANRFDTE
jgi:hypothetical protein